MELIPANWNVAEVCPHQRIWRKLVPRDRGRRLAAFPQRLQRHAAPDGKPDRRLRHVELGRGRAVGIAGTVYFIPRVCNVWTVQAIECLGGDINPWFALTANGLIRQAEKPPNDFELIWPGGGKRLTLDPQAPLPAPQLAAARED